LAAASNLAFFAPKATVMSLADDLAKLEELRHSGALSESEFAKAKQAILSGSLNADQHQLDEHLVEVKYQNELNRIDREWDIERQQYFITNRAGVRGIPTTTDGTVSAVAGGVFGTLWTILAISMTSSGPDAGPFSLVKVIFPVFGVIFTAAAIGYGVNAYNKAQKYQRAFWAYKGRRSRVKRKQY
jgi:hypothetical protein